MIGKPWSRAKLKTMRSRFFNPSIVMPSPANWSPQIWVGPGDIADQLRLKALSGAIQGGLQPLQILVVVGAVGQIHVD